MQPKRRQKDRPRRSFFRPPPAAGAGAFSRPGASVSFVSDGPISSNSGRNGGKNAGRNCVSALPQRATPDSDFPHLLAGITFHHRCRSKGLRVRSPARRLTRPLAPATAEIFRSCRRSRRRGYFAQRRKRFLCLRRPHFFQQRKKWGKERRQKLRFCTSSARYTCLLPSSFFLTRPAFSYPLSVSRLCLHSFPLPLPVTMVKIIRSAVSQAKK